MSQCVLTFIIDISSFYTGLKHNCSCKAISILRAALFKVVMKCKIVMFFLLFGLFFSKCTFLRLQSFISLSIKYPINPIFSVVVRICKIHIFPLEAFFIDHCLLPISIATVRETNSLIKIMYSISRNYP